MKIGKVSRDPARMTLFTAACTLIGFSALADENFVCVRTPDSGCSKSHLGANEMNSNALKNTDDVRCKHGYTNSRSYPNGVLLSTLAIDEEASWNKKTTRGQPQSGEFGRHLCGGLCRCCWSSSVAGRYGHSCEHGFIKGRHVLRTRFTPRSQWIRDE